MDAHGATETVFLGFGTAGSPAPELAVLAAHLDPQPSVKWSEGTSPITGIPLGASVKSVYLPYSDATLFGLLVQGQTAEDVKAAGKAAVAALKDASNIKAEDVKKAVAKAKFTAANSLDSRSGLVSVLGSKVYSSSRSHFQNPLTPISYRCSLVLPLLSPNLYLPSIRLMHLRSPRYVRFCHI